MGPREKVVPLGKLPARKAEYPRGERMSKKRRPSPEREQETGIFPDNWTDRAIPNWKRC